MRSRMLHLGIKLNPSGPPPVTITVLPGVSGKKISIYSLSIRIQGTDNLETATFIGNMGTSNFAPAITHYSVGEQIIVKYTGDPVELLEGESLESITTRTTEILMISIRYRLVGVD